MEPWDVLRRARVILVVGASRTPGKDAHDVPRFLVEHGYRVIPINPYADVLFGERVYHSLDEVPDDVWRIVDVVDVFRPREEALDITRKIVEVYHRLKRPWAIWFQYGTSTPEAVEEAKRAGLIVVEERCMKQELAAMLASGLR